jgi:FKBP-type peptidyl-prolyl cis-trans isomerase (trigger factor)
LPGWIEQEFAAIRKQAGAQGEGAEELRAIAERRLRLGLLLAEMGRRFGMEAANGAEVEERVIDRLLEQARVREREISPEELRRRIED